MHDAYDNIDVAKPFGNYFESAEDFSNFLSFVYDLGFLSGRLISEYFIRYEIQPLVEKGEAAEKEQEIRSSSGGSATKAKPAIQKELCKELIKQAVAEKGLEQAGFILKTRGHCLGPEGKGQSTQWALTHLPVDGCKATDDVGGGVGYFLGGQRRRPRG